MINMGMAIMLRLRLFHIVYVSNGCTIHLKLRADPDRRQNADRVAVFHFVLREIVIRRVLILAVVHILNVYKCRQPPAGVIEITVHAQI